MTSSVLCISGSASCESSNSELLNLIYTEFGSEYEFVIYSKLNSLPLFTPERLKSGYPNEVQELKTLVKDADAIILSTPEYLRNIPAVLKNALEWLTESGELAAKPVVPITFTPTSPRGEYAMKSLIQSLKAIKARIIVELPLYRDECHLDNRKLALSVEQKEMLSAALDLL